MIQSQDWVWSEEALEDSQGRLWLSFTHVWAHSSLCAGHSAQWTSQHVQLRNASRLRQDILYLVSIFHYVEIKQSSRLERIHGSTASLSVLLCCGAQSGCSALKRLACVIRGLWFGTSPECHDVYSEQRAVDFHSFSSLVVFHEDGQILSLLPNQACTSATRVPQRKVPTFSLHFVQGSVCQIRKQLSCVFSQCWEGA